MSGESIPCLRVCSVALSACSVPVSRLPDLIYDTKKDLAEHGLVSTIVGHVGDGESCGLSSGSAVVG